MYVLEPDLPYRHLSFQVALAKVGMDQAVYRDIEDVFNKIEACYFKEVHVLTMRNTRDRERYDQAEAALIDLYTAILEFMVHVRGYLDTSFIGKATSEPQYWRHWIDHGAVGTLKAPISIRKIQDLKRDVDTKHKTSDTKFDALKWAKEFSKANYEIVKWISDQDMLDVHRDLVRRAKTDDMHKSAGRWLLASKEFQDWDGEGLRVFWLCGTGKSLTQIFRQSTDFCSAGTGKTTLRYVVKARPEASFRHISPASNEGSKL
jgi:hypothetical protein